MVGSGPPRCAQRIPQSLPLGLQKADLAWNMAADPPGVPVLVGSFQALIGARASGDLRSRALGLKMQFFFFVQPGGGDSGGIILQTQKSP